MNYDAVLIGSIVTVIGAVVVVAFLAWKVGKLMDQDSKK